MIRITRRRALARRVRSPATASAVALLVTTEAEASAAWLHDASFAGPYPELAEGLERVHREPGAEAQAG